MFSPSSLIVLPSRYVEVVSITVTLSSSSKSIRYLSSGLTCGTKTDLMQRKMITSGWEQWSMNKVGIEITVFAQASSPTIDSIESELINLDLRSIGGKSLPDSSSLRKISHLRGPLVLQISSVRDISCSKMTESSGNTKNRRLLRLKLTDGHSEVTAIEYSYIPTIADDVIPGTKVRLENKTVVRSGIVCLNAKTIVVLGGLVESLYEEWQMNQKYSGVPRSSLRQLQEEGYSGPPPFEKLQVRAYQQNLAQQKRDSQFSMSSSKSSVFKPTGKNDSSMTPQIHNDSRNDTMDDDLKQPTHSEKNEEKPTSSEARPKEVAESFPVQNQAASQKLLQKMSQPTRGNHRTRGQRHRGKGKEEDSHLLTLDEWERSKTGNFSGTQKLSDISQDEDLARQLQEQFDLEDVHVQNDSSTTEAENIRLSMFRFDRDDARAHGTTGFRGRGRGRGRGRRGGRGRT
nr:tudor domain-containing protein 3 [Ipomoea batatas]